MNTFKKDLAFGQKYEREAFQYFDYDKVIYNTRKNKSYDIVFYKNEGRYTVEVKADRRARDTGNLAIEYECYGKVSGISTTTSDYWLHFAIDNKQGKHMVYKIPTNDLRKIVKEGYRSIQLNNSTRARMWLVPTERVKEYICQPTNELVKRC